MMNACGLHMFVGDGDCPQCKSVSTVEKRIWDEIQELRKDVRMILELLRRED